MIDVKVWRVEDRSIPDGVDFWDFPTEERAFEWINEHPEETGKYSTPRLISTDELEVLATLLIRDYLLES